MSRRDGRDHRPLVRTARSAPGKVVILGFAGRAPCEGCLRCDGLLHTPWQSACCCLPLALEGRIADTLSHHLRLRLSVGRLQRSAPQLGLERRRVQLDRLEGGVVYGVPDPSRTTVPLRGGFVDGFRKDTQGFAKWSGRTHRYA